MTAARPDVQAVAKFVRVTPRKARLVADLIRNRTVPEARTILAFSTRAAAREIDKVLRSAVANAESNPNLQPHWNGDECFVSAITIDEGPTIKRFQARARGRVSPIFKRTCHITIKVDKLEGVEAAPKAPKAEAKPKSEPKPKAKAKRTTKKKEAVAS